MTHPSSRDTAMTHHPSHLPHIRVLALCSSLALLGACSSNTPVSTVPGPLTATPMAEPANIERINPGSLFRPGQTSAALFTGRRKPMSTKGPGVKGVGSGIIRSLLNLDASAKGSDSYKGKGKTTDVSSFTGQLTATVTNVLPNGNLVVAGERSVALNGGTRTLRFSGVVNPKDLTTGNVVASSNVANARLEVAGQGDVSEATSRNAEQRTQTNSLSIW